MLQVKETVFFEDMLMVDPRIWIVFGHFAMYAEKFNLPVTITSVINDRKNIASKSSTHEDGRAIDIRSRDWPRKHVAGVIKHMSHIANHYGAISSSDLERRVIIHHSIIGGGEHFHLQVSKY